LDLEKNLDEERRKRRQAEEAQFRALENQKESSKPPAATKEVVRMANEEIKKIYKQMKSLQRKLSAYEGEGGQRRIS